jgi:hypothetical protein
VWPAPRSQSRRSRAASRRCTNWTFVRRESAHRAPAAGRARAPRPRRRARAAQCGFPSVAANSRLTPASIARASSRGGPATGISALAKLPRPSRRTRCAALRRLAVDRAARRLDGEALARHGGAVEEVAGKMRRPLPSSPPPAVGVEDARCGAPGSRSGCRRRRARGDDRRRAGSGGGERGGQSALQHRAVCQRVVLGEAHRPSAAPTRGRAPKLPSAHPPARRRSGPMRGSRSRCEVPTRGMRAASSAVCRARAVLGVVGVQQSIPTRTRSAAPARASSPERKGCPSA